MNKSPSKKIRKLLIALLCLVLIPLIVILVVVQPFFIRAVVFPRVEAATGTSIDVESFSFAPFSRITAENAHVRHLDGEYDLEVESMVLRYDLIRILKGNLEVDQLRLVRPVLQLRMDSEPEPGVSTETTETMEEASDPRIHLRNLEIVEGRVTLLFPEARVELADLQLQIPEIRNGGRIQTHVETSLRIMQPDQPEQPQVEGTISSEIDVQLSETLRPTSFSGGFQAGIQHAELEGRELRVAFTSDLGLELEKRMFQIRTLSGDAQLGDQQILELRLLAPMEVDASESPLRISDTELQMALGPFNLQDVPFSQFLPVQTANVELQSRLKITEAGRRIAASAQFAAGDMEGEFQGVDLSGWNVEGKLDLNGTVDKLEWEDAQVLATHRGVPFLDVTSSGHTRISFEEGDATIRFEPVPLAVVAKRLPEVPIRDGKVSGSGRMRWSDGPEFTFRLDLEGTGLTLVDDKVLPSPLRLDVVGAATADTLTLRTARFAWPATGTYRNELTVSGTADWRDVEAVETHLKINGDALDMKPWYFPPMEKAPVSTKSPATAAAAVPAELKLPPLPLKSSTLSLRLAALRLDDMLIRDLTLDIHAEQQRIELKPVNFRLNESEISSEALFDWSNPLAAYQLKAGMTPLNIQPIADSLLPKKTGALTGVVRGAVQLSGQGTTWSTLREHLRGDLDISLREGQLRLLDSNPDQNAGLLHTRKVVRRVLTALARAVDLSPEQLMEPPLDQVVIRSRIEPGSIHLDQFETMNTEFYLEAHGRITLAELMEASRFEGVPVVIGLNTNLAKRARLYREDRVKGGRVLLPSFLSVKGTLGDPEVDVNRSVVTGLILTGVTERNELGNERVQGILEGLGGILSGEGPPPAPTPKPAVPGTPSVPTPTPSKTDQVLEGFRILRDLRATPTPTPAP